MTPQKSKSKKGERQTQRGQIVVEYVLLLMVAIAIVAAAIKTLVRRKDGAEGGVIIQVWNDMLSAIGKDPSDGID